MSNSDREPVEVKSYSLNKRHISMIDGYAEEMGYPSASSALRRMLDEWKQFKSVQLPLMSLNTAAGGE